MGHDRDVSRLKHQKNVTSAEEQYGSGEAWSFDGFDPGCRGYKGRRYGINFVDCRSKYVEPYFLKDKQDAMEIKKAIQYIQLVAGMMANAVVKYSTIAVHPFPGPQGPLWLSYKVHA